MEKLFRDNNLQEILDRDGVIQIPFLSPSELQELRDFYMEMHPGGEVPMYRDGGLHMTIWMKDSSYKNKIRENLHRILQPAAERNYENFRLVSPVFIVKRKGADSTFPIHQDWNVVDERKHRAFNMWIPMEDVDASNGALWIIKGSQKLPNWVRGAGYIFPNFHSIQDYIREYMVPIPVKAGHALIFYHRVLHGSPPNTQEKPRAVVSMSVLPKDVPLHIFHQKGKGQPLEVYHPRDTFIWEYDNVRDDSPFESPEGEPAEVLPSYQAEPIDVEWWKRNFEGKRPKGWISRIRALWEG